MGVWYCTREDVKSALDFKTGTDRDAQVDRAIEAASRQVESLLHRRFYPELDTRYFDYPREGVTARPWRLWLDENELVSVTSLTSGGEAIGASDYFLEPNTSGPPFNRIEVDLDSTASFQSNSGTRQRSIAVTGVWGYDANWVNAGQADEALDASETGLDVTNARYFGVGDILRVDDEYLIVTDRQLKDTGAGPTGAVAMTASTADVACDVTTGALLNVGEVILQDDEEMLVRTIAGNTITVRRAVNGTLSTHASETVYAYRTLTVTRGALGTTAAAHNDDSVIYRYEVPGPVKSLTIAEAISTIQQEEASYGRTVGSGDNQMEARGAGLDALRQSVYRTHGRQARAGAV